MDSEIRVRIDGQPVTSTSPKQGVSSTQKLVLASLSASSIDPCTDLLLSELASYNIFLCMQL